MQLDVVNKENEKVGSVDVSDDLFGGRVNEHVMWRSAAGRIRRKIART